MQQCAFVITTRYINQMSRRWDCSPLVEENRRNPLNSRVYYHLLNFPMSLGNPFGYFGHPHNTQFWQQLATVAPPFPFPWVRSTAWLDRWTVERTIQAMPDDSYVLCDQQGFWILFGDRQEFERGLARPPSTLFPAPYSIWTHIEVCGEERLARMKGLSDLTDFLGRYLLRPGRNTCNAQV